MGLRYKDLESWRRWQASQRRLHVLKDKVLRKPTDAEPAIELWVRGEDPNLLVACDSNSPTNHHSLLAPLGDMPAIVAKPAGVNIELPGEGWRRAEALAPHIPKLRQIATIGDHLAVGRWAHQLAQQHGWHQWVIQHGLLTPFAPPPPPGATVLTWSDADSEFLREGRDDLDSVTVGSPMLAQAAAHPVEHVSRFETPVFLGQLHGAELSRLSMTRSVTQFWRETGATYRPHPREEDKLSRAQHALWQRMGMHVDREGKLASIDRPVVAAFSTGILEAAARGVPAWAYHLHPPAWLEEFWERYGMSRWGEAPTTFDPLPGDPVMQIRQLLSGC